jgi:hypothetical protein
LVTEKSKHKHSKAMIIMLLPLLAFLFIVGWCMYWVGEQAGTNKTNHKPARNQPKKDYISIMPIVFEEKQEVKNA